MGKREQKQLLNFEQAADTIFGNSKGSIRWQAAEIEVADALLAHAVQILTHASININAGSISLENLM